MAQIPRYKDKSSTQTLREGIDEYYLLNPHVTLPETQPPEFAKVLRAHDASHVIYGCDTGMYDELKLLPLSWWTSTCTFQRYLEMRDTPAATAMYNDLIREKGALWLYRTVLKVLPTLLPELTSIWVKVRERSAERVPFLEFEPLLDRSILDIRQEFELFPFIQ